MSFSDKKTPELTKKCQVRAFKVNTDSTEVLFDQISANTDIKKNAVIVISKEKHLKLKNYHTENGCHYLHFSLFNPKAQVSITPKVTNDKDLVEIENMDNLHAFFIIKENKIASLMQISANHPESKIAKIFEQFSLKLTPTAILRKDVIAKIKNDGFRALHVNVSVDESDFVTPPTFLQSLIQKEPAIKKKGISGHLTIDARGNSELAQSIETNTSIWIDDLDADFYLVTKKGDKIIGDDLKVTKTYYTVPYGSKSISAKYAKEILDDFVAKEL